MVHCADQKPQCSCWVHVPISHVCLGEGHNHLRQLLQATQFKQISSTQFILYKHLSTLTLFHSMHPQRVSWTVNSITYHESNNASATHQIWLRIGINKIWHTYIHSYIRTECKYNTQIKVPAVYVEYTHAHYIVPLCIHILWFCNPLIS